MFVLKLIPIFFLLLIPAISYGAIPYTQPYDLEVSPENGVAYLVGPSPVSYGPDGMMTLVFNKDTGALVGIGNVTTWDTYPLSPYSFAISVGTKIPVASTRFSDFGTGKFRAFICRLDSTPIRYNCDNQDWGYSTYPTYDQAKVNTEAYYFDFESKFGELIKVDMLQPQQTNTNTKFLSLSYSGTSSVVFETEYNLDTSEINSSNSATNPTQVLFQISLRPTSAVSGRSTNIDNTINGTSSATSSPFNFSTSSDGVYDINVKFSNIGCGVDSAYCPFKGTYLYSSFEISGGVLVATSTPEFYFPTPELANDIFEYQECSLTNLTGCLINASIYLFVPSTASYSKITSLFTSNAFPFVNNVYESYQKFTDSIENPATSEALSYSLVIEDANIDVEMFSVAQMEYLMGDTKPVFRSLALLVLLLGFFTMVITSVNKALFFTEYITKK